MTPSTVVGAEWEERRVRARPAALLNSYLSLLVLSLVRLWRSTLQKLRFTTIIILCTIRSPQALTT